MFGLVQAHRFFSSLAELGVKQSGIEDKKLVMHMEFCAKTHGAAEQHVAQVLLSSVSSRHLLCVCLSCVTSSRQCAFRVRKPPGRWQAVKLRSWLLLPRKGLLVLSTLLLPRHGRASARSVYLCATPQTLGILPVSSNAAIKSVCLGQARQMDECHSRACAAALRKSARVLRVS